MNFRDTTPHPCPSCGGDLRTGLLEIHTEVTETCTWKANRFLRSGHWYLAMVKTEGNGPKHWECQACGAAVPEDLALQLGRVIYQAP